MFRCPPSSPLGFALGSQIVCEWLTIRKTAHFLFFTILGLRNLFRCVTVAIVWFFDLLLLFTILLPWDLTSPQSRYPMRGHTLGTPCDPPVPVASASDPMQTPGSLPSHWATSVWCVVSDPTWYGVGRGCMSTGRGISGFDGVLIAWCGPGHVCISPNRNRQITMMTELLCWRGVGGFSRFLIRSWRDGWTNEMAKACFPYSVFVVWLDWIRTCSQVRVHYDQRTL